MCKAPSNNLEYLIIQHPSVPEGADLKESGVHNEYYRAYDIFFNVFIRLNLP